MIFQMDFGIEDKTKVNDKEYIDNLFKEFCKNYINQIKDKLNFSVETLEIDNPKLEIDNPKKDKVENKAKNLLKNPKKINVIRYKLEMVNPIVRKDMREKTKKPKISRPNTQNEASGAKKTRKKHEVI